MFCKLFGISRQGIYQRAKRDENKQEEKQQIIEMTKDFRKNHSKMSGVKVHRKLSREFRTRGIKCGRDKFYDILREENLLIKYRKRFVKTTQSHHWYKTYTNLIQDLDINRSEQVWASDITYIHTKSGFLYLYLITDTYSKQIMGWELADNQKTVNAIRALKMALKNRSYLDRKLIHHSDRGFQYCNPKYTQILKDKGIDISMTTKYDPYENAVAERVNGILKMEYEIGDGFVGQKDAKREIKRAIWLYNNDRPHLSCNYLEPVRAHELENFELKKWPKKRKSRPQSVN